MLKLAYVDDAMSRTRCFEWHARFKSGRTSFEDDERIGRPVTSISPQLVQEVERMVQPNRRVTINEIADSVDVPFGSMQAILTSTLRMRRIAAKSVHWLLTNSSQKEHRVEVCKDLLDRHR